MRLNLKALKTFGRGGVHPPEKKELTSAIPIRNAHIPALATVYLSQHLGSPAKCLVNVGDEVKEGMLIGEAQGFISANIHSPIPGVVKEIKTLFSPQGYKTEAVVIELAGKFDRSGKIIDKRNWEDMTDTELLSTISEMGIVGLGGAAFPTHVKLTPVNEKPIQYLIINGVECEPYLTADHRLMLEKAEEILEGIAIVARVTKAKELFIAIEANKLDAYEILTEKVKERGLNIKVVPLAVKYPQGDEKMVLKALLGLSVPGNKLPLDVGAVVSNVGTVFAIYEAVVWQKPLIERVLTVTGSAVLRPANLKARIGTPIGELIEECGGLKGEARKIVLGGPMMGYATAELTTPVTKGTSGIIVLGRREAVSADHSPCIRCGRCLKACPWGLQPTIMFNLLENHESSTCIKIGLFDCKECGSCAFVCPSEIPLVQAFKAGKIYAKKILNEAKKK